MTQDKTGCVVTKRGSLMQLGEGRVFYPLDPRAEEVDIRDIARSLSRIIRYNGHSDIPIDVAHHSVNTVALARWGKQPIAVLRYMLLHDATEAYVGDMIRPLKIVMPKFGDMEAAVWKVVVEALEIEPIDERILHWYDNVACAWEKRDLFKSAREWGSLPDISDMRLPHIPEWSSGKSYREFLKMYWTLT